MAEELKDPIQLLADKRGVARETIVEELKELNLGQKQPDGRRSGGFSELYERGIFKPADIEGDKVAHEAFGKALGSDQDLFRAFDHYKKITSGGKGVQEILKEAGDSYGASATRALYDKMPWNGTVESGFKQFLYGPYGYVPLADGTYAEPWRKEQAQEASGIDFEESDPEKKDREDKEDFKLMRDARGEQQAQAQAQAVALDRDPEARMLRMQNAQTKNNPFLFGTGGVNAQTDRFLDIAGREKPFRNYSDARMRAKQDLDMDSRAFVADAARENIRELDRLDRGRRATVDNNFENMMQWTVNNPEHKMAKKGPNNWTDQEKIKFVQSLNLGRINLDKPSAAPAPQAPVAQSRALPPQDPFKENTKTDAVFTQPRSPESFEMFFAEGPKNQNNLGPRKEYMFRDPTRPENPVADESFELFMPEDRYPESKPLPVDTTSKDSLGPRREYMFRDPTRPENPVADESFELFMPEDRYPESKPLPVDNSAQASLENPAAAANAFYDNAVKRAQDSEQMVNAERTVAQAEAAPRPVSPAANAFYDNAVKRAQDSERPVIENYPSDNSPGGLELTRTTPEVAVMPPVKHPSSNQPGMELTRTSPERLTMDVPTAQYPPSQDPVKSKPAYTAENAQQDYNEIKAMRDMDEAKRVNQLNSQTQLTNMQKSKAQNIASTKAYHNQTAPTYGRRNDGTYGVMHDPRSAQAMKERSVVMQGLNRARSGDPMQDFMDSSKEEDERKRRQQQFVTASKNSPYYSNYFGS